MMKKILGVMMVAMVWLSLVVPASAVDNEFGGYWRTRAYSRTDFDGADTGTESLVDTRTRLYYTAKFSDKFKFVNKFEIDNVWGDTDGGKIGADGKDKIFEIKNTYADFSVGDHNFKVGIQPGKIARGFLFDDDFSGITMTCKLDTISLPFMWMKAEEDEDAYDEKITKTAANTSDRDYFAISPVFNLNDSLSLNPYLLYDKQQGTDTALFYIGADINAKIDKVTAWGTFIFETGETENKVTKVTQDTTAFLVGAGADAGLVHGQIFYASGNDEDDDDVTAFGLTGQTYYWSEIMGEGLFDTAEPTGTPGTGVTNIIAANIGCTVKAMDKLTLTGDLWYAQLAEEVAGEDELGIEIDLKATYSIFDNLKLDVVAAYLIAGDAIGDEDPMEIGTQLSLSF